ncbi:MAG: hypothetical protein QOH12_3706 [Solirubrobacteraceae bacterium]|nr:hypothetical protein [Solirubrobacteraceae bacterium]
MPFVDFLRSTVLLCAGAASALAAVTVIGAGASGQPNLPLFAFGWWGIATVIGIVIGRRNEASPPIARLLAGARAIVTMPEEKATRVLINRLWPLFGLTLVAFVIGFFAPQVPGIATGFAIIWALAWRRQHAAVAAIELRDGARFHVEPTSPIEPMSLTRTPGFKSYPIQQHEQAA